MLKKIQRVDYSGYYNYSPPVIDGAVNTDEISSIREANPDRLSGPFVCLKMRNGEEIIARGVPGDFITE